MGLTWKKKAQLKTKLAVLKDLECELKELLPGPVEAPARCSGHCCRGFTMPQSPERIWAMYEDWLKQSNGSFAMVNDIHLVAPMLVYLGVTDKYVSGAKIPNGEVLHLYTCKHHDEKTGNCSIYEHRPQMCRDYPYGYACTFKDCTMRPKIGGESLYSAKKDEFDK